MKFNEQWQVFFGYDDAVIFDTRALMRWDYFFFLSHRQELAARQQPR